MKVHGNADVTISNGKVIWENGELNVEAGSGRFIPVKPNCEYVFGTVESRKRVTLIIV
jgi:dihydropyrimidinase